MHGRQPGANVAALLQVGEAVTLAANVSIHNPRGYRTWHCNRMETATAPPEQPTRDFWNARMVRCRHRQCSPRPPSP